MLGSRTGLGFALVSLGALGCVGAGGGGGGADDVSVGLTTAGGATTVASGGSLVIQAHVNNASNMEVGWSLAGPACPASCGTLTPTSTDFATYLAPPDVLVPFTVTVTATSVQSPGRSGSVTLTVLARICEAGAEFLQGPYAFLLQGFSAGTGVAAVGSLTFDGCGSIATGEVDYHFGPIVTGHLSPLSGDYRVSADRRGRLTLLGRTFAIALGKLAGGIATLGAMTQMDSADTLSGSLWRQDPAAFSQSAIGGPFAFALNGWNGSGPREALGGTVHADGAGNLDAGLLDRKAFGSEPVAGVAWTGSYGSPSSSGRSVLTAPALTGASGTAVGYAVGPGRLLALISDPAGAGRVFSGTFLAQAPPFDLGSLSGGLVAYQTANYTQAGYEGMTMSALTVATADGAGHLSVTGYANFGGNPGPFSSEYTYTVATDGRASIYDSSATFGGYWYLTGPRTALMLGFDPGASVGAVLPRAAGPFGDGSIAGSYFASQAPGGARYSVTGSGVGTSAGDGTLATTMDLSVDGWTPWGQTASATLGVTAEGWAGDVTTAIYLMVSADAFLAMDLGTFYPVVRIFER